MSGRLHLIPSGWHPGAEEPAPSVRADGHIEEEDQMNRSRAMYLVELSRRENRIVTERPETRAEEMALLDDLMSTDGYLDSVDVLDDMTSRRGRTDVWGEDWRISVVHAEIATGEVHS